MRALVVLTTAIALAACGGSDQSAATPVGTPVGRCVDRLLTNANSEEHTEDVRAYVRRTYCERFAARGWVYDDGALSIDAQRWSETGACAFGTEGEPTVTVPCEELTRTDPILDCAVLRHVRRTEVRAYVQRLDREVEVRCDDGTPLDELGVP